MSSLLNVTEANELVDAMKNDCVVMFSAPYCGPCRAIKPVYERIAQEYANVRFLYANIMDFVDPERKIIESIEALPTFHFYKSGELVATQTGADQNKLKQNVTTTFDATI